MLRVCKPLAAVLVCVMSAPGLGGLVVTSYRTVASTNGYAPVSQAQYFAEQRLENVSPAVAEVFGDWRGPNADGTPDTWHFVGTARASSTTTITPDSYTVEAAASFGYQIDTTVEFIDPRSTGIFGPGGTGQYRGFFEADVPLVYTISGRLNQRGRVRLSQFGGPEVVDESNSNVAPQFLNLSGTIPAGRYQYLATTSLSSPILPTGVNRYVANGSFENLVFAVRIPEPSLLGTGLAVATRTALRRRRTETGTRLISK